MINKLGKAVAALIIAAAITGCGGGPAVEKNSDKLREGEPLNVERLSDAPEVQGMKLVAKSSAYALYLDAAASDIAVRNLATGQTIHSNPTRGIAGFTLPEAQLSPNSSVIEINYTNLSGKVNTYSSYKDSVLYEQNEYYKIDNGFRAVYTLGRDEGKRLMPPILRVESYQAMIEMIDKGRQGDVRQLYRNVRHDRLPREDGAQLLEKYPRLADDDFYILRTISRYDKNVLEATLTEAGYTMEQMHEEMEYAGYERDESDVIFIVSVDLTVDDEGFAATVDLSGIDTAEGYKVTEINVLKGFGATTDEDGFIFMPDGSGILMKLHNPETQTLQCQIYGVDPVIAEPYAPNKTMQCVMPVFAIKTSAQTVFGIIEKGAAISGIVGNSRSPFVPLASVYPRISANAKDYQNYGGLKTNPSGLVLPSEDPVASVTIRYSILEGGETDYNDLAAFYQRYLLGKGALAKRGSDKTPFYVELLGAINKMVVVAGVPVEKRMALTTYKQAEEIFSRLIQGGADGLKLRYRGWASGGLINYAFTKATAESVLGGNKGLGELLSFLDTHGVGVFLDAPIDGVKAEKAFDGFDYRSDAARRLDHKVGATGGYSVDTRERDMDTYIVSPAKLQTFEDRFLASYKWNAGLSLGGMGGNISSDYRVGAVITRERSEEIYRQVFTGAVNATGPLLSETGNAYTWEYTADIAGLPSSGSGYYAQLRSVPFLQMVLRGYIDYALSPLNLSGDLRRDTLKAIELGAGIYVQMIYAEDITLVDTLFDNMYSLNYQNRLDEYCAAYKEVAAALNRVAGQRITGHKNVSDGVYATTYANGVTITVDYAAGTYTVR